ncbi:scavenger receptor cysteine-rich type 1 protein M160 [Carassius gibelio]|uniref:scavenger receptor cysteine-rich type 1 protein M160 n=1 Tax=Carassius gibelio TaxID=101364 RepID=UPI002279298D|nr:scavenger receptor cysteine-rich type 1 protein M160 [Carassius gibelio]
MTLYKDPPLPQQYWMDQVKCTSGEESLWKCPYVDINKKEKCDENSFVAVECSGEVKLSLNLNGQRDVCAGVVEFSTANGIIGVCNDNWANKTCQELGCGDVHYSPKPGMFKGQQSKRNVMLNCVGNEKFSWQCMERSDCRERASVICSNHRRFSLQDGSDACSGLVEEKTVKQKSWNPVQPANVKPEVICPQLNCGSTGNFTKGTNILTCSDRVKLQNFTADCFGDVSIAVNGIIYGVCYSDQDSIQSRKKMGAMVCRELGCGEILRVKKGSFTSNGFLSNVDCQGDERSLWHCLAIHEKQTCTGTNVICSEEELKFFEGDSPCKGKVRIKQFDDKTASNLPATPEEENKKKANDACKAMQCGTLLSFELGQNTKDAKVTCSGTCSFISSVCKMLVFLLMSHVGTKTLALENSLGEKCWGIVKVCGDDQCGGVCSNNWRTEEDSRMICGNLGCGNPIQAKLPLQINNLPATYSSVYCSENVQNMIMCNFIPNKNPTCKPLAHVICTDSIKARLEDPRDKCAGKASLFYAGKWTPICKDSLNTNLKNLICKELSCGDSINDQHDWISQEESKSRGLSGIKCLDNANSVSKCDLKEVSEKECIDGYLKCSAWKRLLLYNKEGECSGPVYGLRDRKTPTPVSISGWGNEEGQKLCEYLQCGNFTSSIPKDTDTNEWWNKTYKCSGKKNIWECESNDQPVQNQQQLNIQCNHKPPKMMLSKNCTGEVLIDEEHVCASRWDDGMSNKLCDSLNCGKALYSWTTESREKNTWHFSCTGIETSVWQCGSRKDSCKNILSVACKDSVEFNSTEKCGGKLVIKYQGRWEYVCGKLTPNDNKKFCDVLKCNDRQELLEGQIIEKEIKVKINCPETHYNIFQCMHHLNNDKCSHGPAEIKCEGYIPKTADNTPKGGNSSVGLILGLSGAVLGLLILFLMWRNRKRLLLALRYYRSKKGKDVSPDVNEMDKMDTGDKGFSEEKASFLDDDYEDVDSLMDKSGEEDEDDRKRDSSGTEYDDIEGQANGISPSQTHHDEDLDIPLLPKRPENILDQDTYEVETEKQQDYDDVMSVEATANENAGMTGTQAHVDVDMDEGADSDLDAGLFANADADMLTTEVEVHAQGE